LLAVVNGMDLEPSRLELEITESMIMKDIDSAIGTVNALRLAGIHISIDDFGTGYCSFAHLRRFAFDVVKLDRSFVRELNGDPENSAITDAIIQMAHALNAEVVAEGVENAAELKILRSQNCDLMQGYLFSRPVKAAEIQRMLEAQRHRLLPKGSAPTIKTRIA
jgi:EAL domain-containing protein (putative c-di-GMP-specific phosphodiesterase class I)